VTYSSKTKKFPPEEALEITSPLSPSQAAAALAAVVEPPRRFRLGGGHRDFEGHVGSQSFEIRRIVATRNSFVPVVRGTLIESPHGTRVAIVMRPRPSAMAFMYLWFALVAILALAGPIGVLAGYPALWPLVPAGPTLVAIGWAVMSSGFWSEASRARVILSATLKTESNCSPPPQS
jgi:hypothetical protein